jgi:hypothetical protein
MAPAGSWAVLQSIIHLLEGLLGLFEEAKNNRAGELAIVFIIVHLEDLLESDGINILS